MILKKPSKRRFKYTKKRHTKKRHTKKRHKGSSFSGDIGDILTYPSFQNIKVDQLSYGGKAGTRNITPRKDESENMKISINSGDNIIIITGNFQPSLGSGQIIMKNPLIEKLDSIADTEKYIIYSSEHEEEGPDIHYRIIFQLETNNQLTTIYQYLPQDIGPKGRRFFFPSL